MITEDYVSFEIAKLLKEKGFQAKCTACYHSDPSHTLELVSGRINYCNPRFSKYKMIPPYNAPTIQMAMKWLREVHNQIIVPGIRVDDQTSSIINCYIVGIWYIPKNNGGAFCYKSPTPYNGYPSYEKACEDAIKYCLEHLI